MLCHQGGIRHYRPDEPTFTRRFDSFAEALALFRDDPLIREPGSGVRYSTYGYNLLGCAGAGGARTAFLTLLGEAVFGPAGMTATGADVARFGSALLSGRLLSPETLEQMLTRQKTRDGRVTGYGLGLTLGEREGRPEAWHTGGQERVSNVLYLSLDRGVAGGGRSVAILTNLERVQPEMLALARRVAGLWPLAAAPTASEAARRAVSRHF